VLKECVEFLKDVAQIETDIRMEGKKMFIILAPIKKKK
jgi:translation initiation factor IF-3